MLPAKKLEWAKNEIDYFIYEKLKQEKLKPSPQADKSNFIEKGKHGYYRDARSGQLGRKIFARINENAYEELVDSLLASPHYGEKWTSMWMDLARYADTKGYERDDSRSIWRYRDWLIQAFNEDKPYDQFLTEQIAGDLMPDPTGCAI